MTEKLIDISRYFINLPGWNGLNYFLLFFMLLPFLVKNYRLKLFFWAVTFVFFYFSYFRPKSIPSFNFFNPVSLMVIVFGLLSLFILLNKAPWKALTKKIILLFFVFLALIPIINHFYLDSLYSKLILPPETSFKKISGRSIFYEENFNLKNYLNEAFKFENLQYQKGYLHPDNKGKSAKLVYRFSSLNNPRYISLSFIGYLLNKGNFFRISVGENEYNLKQIFFREGEEIAHSYSTKINLSEDFSNANELFISFEMFVDKNNANPSYSHLEFFKFETIE